MVQLSSTGCLPFAYGLNDLVRSDRLCAPIPAIVVDLMAVDVYDLPMLVSSSMRTAALDFIAMVEAILQFQIKLKGSTPKLEFVENGTRPRQSMFWATSSFPFWRASKLPPETGSAVTHSNRAYREVVAELGCPSQLVRLQVHVDHRSGT